MTAAENGDADIAGRAKAGNSLTVFIDRITRVPSQYRVYDHTAAMAKAAHGISSELAADLLECGMPHQVADGVVYLDELDLANVSFQLGLPSARAMALRSWGVALRSAHRTADAYEVTFRPRCPAPGHDGHCDLTQPAEVAASLGREITQIPREGFTVRYTTGVASIELPAAFWELTSELADVHYHLLPPQLHGDLGFLARTGLADCPLAAEYLFQAALARELPARKSFGVLVSVPFSIPHFWLELMVGASWHAIDPHLIRMLALRGLVDQQAWPPHRTLGGAAWRLADRDLPLAEHNGVEIPCSMPTKPC